MLFYLVILIFIHSIQGDYTIEFFLLQCYNYKCHFIFPLTSLLKGGERVEKIFIHSNADSHIYIAI
ncbi:hypothetical protein HMPREF9093_01479 [Fusobacterium sp. oral taxon 370 str. F0437]|nr:hypothetical protein HMPREF9093_01479 [Fusobacterium sp. oral taxon 370 str. F0437]